LDGSNGQVRLRILSDSVFCFLAEGWVSLFSESLRIDESLCGCIGCRYEHGRGESDGNAERMNGINLGGHRPVLEW
jgi:hypothetical protein